MFVDFAGVITPNSSQGKKKKTSGACIQLYCKLSFLKGMSLRGLTAFCDFSFYTIFYLF